MPLRNGTFHFWISLDLARSRQSPQFRLRLTTRGAMTDLIPATWTLPEAANSDQHRNRTRNHDSSPQTPHPRAYSDTRTLTPRVTLTRHGARRRRAVRKRESRGSKHVPIRLLSRHSIPGWPKIRKLSLSLTRVEREERVSAKAPTTCDTPQQCSTPPRCRGPAGTSSLPIGLAPSPIPATRNISRRTALPQGRLKQSLAPPSTR